MKPLVIKVKEASIKKLGSIFNAVRGHWYVNLDRVSTYTHVIVCIIGTKTVSAVFKADKWNHSFYSRYHFEGTQDKALENKLLGKELNHELFKKGRRNPVNYMTEQNLLEA